MRHFASRFATTLRSRIRPVEPGWLFPFEVSITLDDVMDQLTFRADGA